MRFEWDEDKQKRNAAKHGLNFADAKFIFRNPHVGGEAKSAGPEIRHMATGMLGDVFVTLVFTWRGDVIRVISMRKASRNERRQYRQVHGGGT